MRKKLVLFFCLLNLIKITYSQVFWTENFNNGCVNGCTAVGYTGANGPWSQTILGPEGTEPNAWYVSCAEQNNGIGACSSGCTGGGNASLHISADIANPFCPNDCGAAYDAGGLCGLIACPQTNRRIESPVINCAGKTSISVNYAFIHKGTVGVDFASVWYFNGATWVNLGAVPQVVLCGGQGTWTGATIALPASANNNAGVKIGFSWENNDDGAGTDPSIAIDDVTLSVPTPTTPPMTLSLSLPSPVCQSNTITATFTSTSTPTSFTWSANSANVVLTPVNSGTTTISFTAPGTYTVSLTACQGTVCGTAASSIQVLPTPTINVTASPTVVCVPGSSTLTATGGLSTSSYTWTASSGPAITNTNVAVVSPTANTTYTVLTSIPGCTTAISITVPAVSAPTLTLTPNSSICNGQSINLTASGASTYTWSPAATLSSPNGAVVTATPATTTTYTVIGSNGSCTNTAAVTVTVSASASVSIAPTNTTICSGQGATLTASGGSTYTWTASSGTNPPGTASVGVTPTITTTYTVLTGSGSCTAQAVASVSVAPALTTTVTPVTSTICTGGTGVVLTAGGATTYSWSAAAGLSSTSGSTVNAAPVINTTYTVTGSNGVCTSTAITNIYVTSLSPSITVSSSSVCLSQSIAISTQSATGLTYTWQPTTEISGSVNGFSIAAMPSGSATVIYTVTISNGICIRSGTVQLQVFSAPVNNFITLNNDTICTGGCVTFSATTSGSQPISYEWYYESGIGTSSVGIAPEACYPSAGSFSVMSVSSNVCGTDTVVKSNFVQVYDLPVLIVYGDTMIKIGGSAEVFSSGGLSYSWSSQPVDVNIACPTCSNTVVQPIVTTLYIVIASNSPYCKVQDTVTVTVDTDCGEFFVPNVFSPNDDGLNDLINIHGRCLYAFTLQIFDRWGEKVFETSSLENSWDGTFKGKRLDTGVFVYKVDGVAIDGQSFNLKGNITLLR